MKICEIRSDYSARCRSYLGARVLATFPRRQERLTNLGAQLSGGEQQMLSIGRAMMTHPELIVLDEATEGLRWWPLKLIPGRLARVANPPPDAA